MSRPIKFRAWDTENQTWTFVTLGDLVCGACLSIGDKPLSGAPQIWEQYTGLKDKNGIEIYEGDIIREVVDAGDGDREYQYEVYWDDVTLTWSLRGGTYIHDDLWEANASREIIGNIHENPELLGGEK